MGKYSGILLCTDIDGTLTYDEKGSISKKNSEKINFFKEEGGLFTISTGRAPHFISGLPVTVNAPIISIGGNLIYDTETKTELLEGFVPPVTREIYFETIKNYKKHITDINIHRERKTFHYDGNNETELINHDKINKVLFVFDSEEAAKSARDFVNKTYFGKIDALRSWNVSLELLSPVTTKGNGIRFLKEYYGGKVHTAVAVGDYENDISMIRAADISYAVENAENCVKEAATRTAPKNTDDAIAYIIDNL